jgi:O-antigen ligase
MDIHQKQQLLNRIQEYTIYLFIFLMPLTHKEAYSIFQPDLVWSKFVLMFGAISGVYIFFKNYKFYLQNIYFRLLAIYLGFQILSLLRTEDVKNSLLFIGFFVSILFLYVYVYDFVLRNKNAFENFTKVYLIAFAFLLGFLARQIYLQENFQVATGGVWPVPGYPTRYGSTFWDVNHFGIYLGSLFLLFVGYLFNNIKIKSKADSLFEALTPIRARILIWALSIKGLSSGLNNEKISFNKSKIILFTSATFLILYALKLTGSRSSLIGLGVGIFVFIVGYAFIKNKLSDVFINYRSLLFIALANILPIIIMVIFKEEIRTAFLYRAVSFYAHLFLLKVGILTGLENFFFGIGVNAFSEYFKTSIWADSYYYIDRAALNLKLPLHNLWLESWVETGVFSFIFFALLWIVCISDLYKIYKQKKDYFALGLASGIIVFLVGGLFYSYKSEFFWFYAVMAFAYASTKIEHSMVFNFQKLRSLRPWMFLISAISLIFPVLFFTMPPVLEEIYNYYYYMPDNKFFDLWIILLDNFRYIIGNYSFTGRFLMVFLYFSAIFSSLSLLRKLNISFLQSLLTTAVIFTIINIKTPLIMVSFTNFMYFMSIILVNMLISILPIKRRISCEVNWQNNLLGLFLLAAVPFSINHSFIKYTQGYDTNVNFLVELASNRSKTNDALIFVDSEELIPLVKYYADRLEDDESGRFYMIDSYIINLNTFNCENWVFMPGQKYLFLVNSNFACSRLEEGLPNVSVISQGDSRLIIYEEKIRNPSIQME